MTSALYAPRDEPAVLVADLDLDARRDWLKLFPSLATRRPDAYPPAHRPALTQSGGTVLEIGPSPA